MTVSNLRERARLYVGKNPSMFFGFYSTRQRHRRLLVNPATEIVIEGFPRSGNTFAVSAFEYAQPKSMHIAHHLHAPAQIMRAVRWKIPTLLLVREPLDAVVSLMLRDPRFSAEQALEYYVSFYENVVEYQDGFVLGRFEDITRDYGAVIEQVNYRFGTEFEPFAHTDENVERVFSIIEDSHRARRQNKLVESQIARPSVARSGLKADAMNRLLSPELESLTSRARAAYGALTENGERRAGLPLDSTTA